MINKHLNGFKVPFADLPLFCGYCLSLNFPVAATAITKDDYFYCTPYGANTGKQLSTEKQDEILHTFNSLLIKHFDEQSIQSNSPTEATEELVRPNT